MHDEAVVEVDHVSKKFCRSLRRSLWYGLQDMAGELVPWRQNTQPDLRQDEFWALRDVSFRLTRGEALAVIGPNGAGKSTLVKLLSGIIKPDIGSVSRQGRLGTMLQPGNGFSPVLSGRENIYASAAMLGLSHSQTKRSIEDIIGFAELAEFIDSPVQNYSSGMRARLSYAVAAYLNPNVMLLDEALAVGDAAFRRKCLRHIQSYINSGGSVIVVTHSMPIVEMICTRCLVLNRGIVEFEGEVSEGTKRYFSLLHSDATSSGMTMSGGDATEQTITGQNLHGQGSAAAPRGSRYQDPIRLGSPHIKSELSGELDPSQPAVLSLTYEASRMFENVIAWIEIRRDGHSVAREFLQIDNLPANSGRIRMRLHRLSLLGGTYTLSAGIVDEDCQSILAENVTPLQFTVPRGDGILQTLRTAAGSIVSIETQLMDITCDLRDSPDDVRATANGEAA